MEHPAKSNARKFLERASSGELAFSDYVDAPDDQYHTLEWLIGRNFIRPNDITNRLEITEAGRGALNEK